jgi:hypothetical protein
METNYLNSLIKQFEYYKLLGEKAMAQLTDEQLFQIPSAESNSIAIIVQHLSGNMLSRWTDFLNSDGEKEWRKRDEEFETVIKTKSELDIAWNKGWDVFLNTLSSLTENDLNKIVYIRNQGHTVMEAISRQLAHYPYHIGQIVFLAKLLIAKPWESLSIAKNRSSEYNSEKFSQEKSVKHFTDEYIKKKKE